MSTRHGLHASRRMFAAGLYLFVAAFLAFPTDAPAEPTDPCARDTDGDGYVDGPDCWVFCSPQLGRALCAGEDKNGNGKYEPAGADGNSGNEDDESDPNNPSSIPRSEQILKIDSDCDGLTDDEEDFYHTNPKDRDTDDDGLADGWEVLGKTSGLPPHVVQLQVELLNGKRADPTTPDADNDSRPDGLEVGAWLPVPAMESIEAKSGTDLERTFTIWNRDPDAPEVHSKCFVPDTDHGAPESSTSPMAYDSNLDGLSDNDQDANRNGRRDEGEDDPVFGLWPDPHSHMGFVEFQISNPEGQPGPCDYDLIAKAGTRTGRFSIVVKGGHLTIQPAAITFARPGEEIHLQTSLVECNKRGVVELVDDAGTVVYSTAFSTGPFPHLDDVKSKAVTNWDRLQLPPM